MKKSSYRLIENELNEFIIQKSTRYDWENICYTGTRYVYTSLKKALKEFNRIKNEEEQKRKEADTKTVIAELF